MLRGLAQEMEDEGKERMIKQGTAVPGRRGASPASNRWHPTQQEGMAGALMPAQLCKLPHKDAVSRRAFENLGPDLPWPNPTPHICQPCCTRCSSSRGLPGGGTWCLPLWQRQRTEAPRSGGRHHASWLLALKKEAGRLKQGYKQQHDDRAGAFCVFPDFPKALQLSSTLQTFQITDAHS